MVRPSACPGLLRIVAALDGGICRIKLPCGRLTTQQAAAIAAGATRYGSGVVEITNRANLQLRGIDLTGSGALIDALLAAGLGPTVAGADDVRNVLVSPTAGIDAGALLDIEPLALRTLDLLQGHTGLHRLTPKFALLLDGGERAAMLEHPHDIWLSAMSSGELAFGLAGCPPVRAFDTAALAAVPFEHALELIEAALQLFLEYARPDQTRMRHLLADISAPEFLNRLRQRVPFALRIDADVANWRRTPAQPAAHIGIHAQRNNALSYIGAVPVLGRIDAAQLRVLAELANKQAAMLRFTPWQSVVIANVPRVNAPWVAEQLRRLGFSCDAGAVLSHTIACSGASGCVKGLADTKGDALPLAARIESIIAASRPRAAGVPITAAELPSIHLTGCLRSCAAAHCAAFTLLAGAPGRYTVYRRADSDAASRFGRMLAESVDIETAAALIANAWLNTEFSHTDPEPV